MADAAKSVGVQHYIWSSLFDVEKISGGKIDLPHFTNKHKVEEYIRSLKLPATFVHAGFYITNLSTFFKPQVESDGTLNFMIGIKPETQLPMVDTERDTGYFVKEALEHKDQYLDKDILMAAEYLTFPQIVETYKKVTGKPARYTQTDIETTRKYAGNEIADMFKYFDEYGYFNKQSLDVSKKIHPTSRGYEQWLRDTGFVYKN